MSEPSFPFPAVGTWRVKVSGARPGEPPVHRRRVPVDSRIHIAEAVQGWRVRIEPPQGPPHDFSCRLLHGDGLESRGTPGEDGERDRILLRRLPGAQSRRLLVGVWLRRDDGRGETPLEVWTSEEDEEDSPADGT